MDPVIVAVKNKMSTERLAVGRAAALIGVTAASLERHLAGSYVRSDSLAKYRRWLDGAQDDATAQVPLLRDLREQRPARNAAPLKAQKLVDSRMPPEKPHYVIDLFSGCGGLALGFDLLDSGAAFRTVLALDIEEPMVRAFNDNFVGGPLEQPICRRVDLSDLINEAEVLAFYLDHLSRMAPDPDLHLALESLRRGPLSAFRDYMAATDAAFAERLSEIRSSPAFRDAYARIEPTVMGQTSVIGFHRALGLPMLSSKQPAIGPLVWADVRASANVDPCAADAERPVIRRLKGSLEKRWNSEVAQLKERTLASGMGQLASSARKIDSFLRFIESPGAAPVRAAWLEWRANRDAARASWFGALDILDDLRHAYTPERSASVILGGPPCQGFSRIGRGKIRSLREHGVHVQEDAEAGDERNRLLLKYTLFVAALRPKVFLFENVRHFQAEVQTPEGTFKAPDVLAEAIRDISTGGAEYSVAMATIDCSAHLVPQTRERFVMAGVRSDVATQMSERDLARWTLALAPQVPVTLRTALEALPEPVVVGPSSDVSGLSTLVEVHLEPSTVSDAPNRFLNWVRQDVPEHLSRAPLNKAMVDGHAVRAPRRDDRQLYRLMGPGMRWMDYRCDESSTLKELSDALKVLSEAVEAAEGHRTSSPALRILGSLDPARIRALHQAMDGSLSLRLLLECIDPLAGELRHHLLTPGYLAKREGNHGDWLARMDPERPSKTIVSHMAKDTYMYVHPFSPRTLSVREAARIQTFPDWFRLGSLGLVDGFRVIGNAVPPLLSYQFAEKVAELLSATEVGVRHGRTLKTAT